MPTAISAIIAVILVAACTHHDLSQTARVDIGSNVLLKDYALVCKQPSEELNNIAKNNGKDLRDLYEKIFRHEGCYDASSFEQGQWKVLARNDTQLLIKMQGRAGEYWVSNMHISLGELSAVKAEKTPFQSSL
ncbi:hypothetical protein ACI48D_22580 [Massilia sp. LXY-6]|uniref:hypothetical protein n=1 Tax=Massilia sp. LXY-6 TaxID=3379823 RepID=UPI003EE29332